MDSSNSIVRTKEDKRKHKTCVSCGGALPKRKQKYCSMDCRDKLLFALRWLTNLLQPLRTRYASFFFTGSKLIINLISYHSKESLTYYSNRTPGILPAKDLQNMILSLSRQWHNENERMNCRQLASISVLEKAHKGAASFDSIKLKTEKRISKVFKYMTCLKIPMTVLESESAHQTIKSAYRKEVMKHHPDHGGEDELFISIVQSYNEIMGWIKNPTYSARRGIRGMWSYDGDLQKWYPPM